jgi:hypothetical protein
MLYKGQKVKFFYNGGTYVARIKDILHHEHGCQVVLEYSDGSTFTHDTGYVYPVFDGI